MGEHDIDDRLIEEAWQEFRLKCLPMEADWAQVRDMREAFFGGALYLFAALIERLDQGDTDEPSARDLARMEAIHAELDKHVAEVAMHAAPVAGSRH